MEAEYCEGVLFFEEGMKCDGRRKGRITAACFDDKALGQCECVTIDA